MITGKAKLGWEKKRERERERKNKKKKESSVSRNKAGVP